MEGIVGPPVPVTRIFVLEPENDLTKQETELPVGQIGEGYVAQDRVTTGSMQLRGPIWICFCHCRLVSLLIGDNRAQIVISHCLHHQHRKGSRKHTGYRGHPDATSTGSGVRNPVWRPRMRKITY